MNKKTIMNKRTIITIMFALVAMTGLAQEIKMNETTINDYISMLNQKAIRLTALKNHGVGSIDHSVMG